MTALLLYGLLALGVSFLCSLLEAALLSVPMSYTEMLAAGGRAYGARLRDMKRNPDLPLSAILSLNTIAHTVGAAGVGSSAAKVWGSWAVGLASAMMTLLILVLSEIIPKTLGAVHARGLAHFTVIATRWMMLLTWPLTVAMEGVSRVVGRQRQRSAVERGEVLAALTMGHESGELSRDEHRIAANLLALHRIQLSQILTPRTVLFTLEEGLTVAEVLAEHEELPFSRIPVHGGEADRITGYVARAEVYHEHVQGRPETPLSKLRRDMTAVPELATVRDAMRQMLLHGEQMLLVVDEFGGVEGVVTLEDTVETLLGVEITDETDPVDDLQALARLIAERRA